MLENLHLKHYIAYILIRIIAKRCEINNVASWMSTNLFYIHLGKKELMQYTFCSYLFNESSIFHIL